MNIEQRRDWGTRKSNKSTPPLAAETWLHPKPCLPSITKLTVLSLLAIGMNSHAAILTPTGSTPPNYFGTSVSLSGGDALIGAYYDSITGTSNAGAAYYFSDVGDAVGTVSQDFRLNSSTPTATEFFGVSTALSGSIGMIGTTYSNSSRGSVFLFRNLGSASTNQTQATTLSITGAAINANFGKSVSISGTTGLVGASGNAVGGNAAYLYRGLNTLTGNPNPTAKLIANGAAATAGIGTSVSISGTNGLVGASAGNKVYLYRNLNTATGDINQSAVLTGSTNANSGFGRAVSLDGGRALVGAPLEDIVYLYRGLDSTSSTDIAQVAKLVASDDNGTFGFGTSVAVSGNYGIVGASQKSSSSGGAYIYTNLDGLTGNSQTETVRITAKTPVNNTSFGISVALEGDDFIVGARGNTSTLGGATYTGSISSMTTLDAGSTSKTIDHLAFNTRADWVVGKATDANSVRLTLNSAATLASGKNVYVGQEAGSDNNILTIEGALTAGSVYVGSTQGNSGNSLVLGMSSSTQIGSIYLAPENLLSIQGDFSDATALFTYLSGTSTTLYTYGDTEWEAVNAGNYADSISIGFENGYTNVTSLAAIPEPSVGLLAGMALGAGVAVRRRKHA